MSDAPPTPQPPRKPVWTPPAIRPPAPAGAKPKAIAPPRIIAPTGGSPPAPGAIVRQLTATRGWALVNAAAFVIVGGISFYRAIGQWRALKSLSQIDGAMDQTTLLLLRGENFFLFAFAAGCIFVAPKLLRYSGAVSRLSQGGRMHELEAALRHQRTVWVVLGSLGAMWLLLFGLQLAGFAMAASELNELNEGTDEFEEETEMRSPRSSPRDLEFK